MTIFMYIFNGISEFLVLRRVRLLEGAVFSFFFFRIKPRRCVSHGLFKVEDKHF